MKASAGGYARAQSLGHALELLEKSDGLGRILAGGQSLVAAMNMRLTTGDMLVDISRLSDLRGVVETEDGLRIGALTRHADIAENPLVRQYAPLLNKASHYIAHAAIRNRGTIGGALAHADPAAEFPACVLALGAEVEATGPNGTRAISADELFEDVFETTLDENEILTAITVPKADPTDVHVIEEVARRSGDYALAGLCLVKLGAAHRVSLFSVGPRPILATQAMTCLDAGDLEGAVQALSEEIDPPSDTQATSSYRKHISAVLLRRAVAQADEAA